MHSGKSSTVNGSSPHAWGIRPPDAAPGQGQRFIPTCVGNTWGLGSGWISEVGSSPHAWGIHLVGVLEDVHERFIPTCVGNTCWSGHKARARTVHPHMRGEYRRGARTTGSMFGSSPHAWGILMTSLPKEETPRFIPTCVGNTSALPWRSRQATVHPHMRGEYSSRKHEEFSMVIIAAKIYRSGTA